MQELKAKAAWVFWLILGIGIAILTLFLRKLFSSPKEEIRLEVKTPEILKKKVETAEEEYLKVKITNELKADELDNKLKEIAEIEEGSERRKRLAELINKGI